YGAKTKLLDSVKRTFGTLQRPFSDFRRVFQARGSHASINVSISIRSLWWIKRASRITFWFSAIFLLIGTSNGTSNAWLIGVLAVTAVLAVIIYVVALWLGQTLEGRDFAAALASDPVGNRPIILFLRSFAIAQSSLGGRVKLELGYMVRGSF